MNRLCKTMRTLSALVMLVSFYFPLCGDGDFRTLFFTGSLPAKVTLLFAALCSALVIAVNVHGEEEGIPARASMILFALSSACLLAFMIAGKKSGWLSFGTILYFGAALLGTASSLSDEAFFKRDPGAGEGAETAYAGEIRAAGKTPPARKAGELHILCGELHGSVISVDDSEAVLIGRDPSFCNIVIAGKGISRRHCMLTYMAQADRYTLMDLSTNGTYVIRDGRRRRLPKNRAAELCPGTLFDLASVENTFSLG